MLTPGVKLGPYEVLTPLGAGGMGEVWRARDTRLGRDVALKALPAAFAKDPERLARFEREARLLASLSHPGIGAIHTVEEAQGTRYLVLELIEGETLAARLARGALPVDEAIDVCGRIAAAVEAAHEAGVIHRDLKPANVMCKPDGSIKVLDFGLARVSEPHASETGDAGGASQSPTQTSPATVAGVILGTAAYMAPEQARGRTVDRRADIWAFGCVLYECLTGRVAFAGDTVSDTLASILKTEPDMTRLPAATPVHVRQLLQRCLRKDPRERLRDIGDARIALEDEPPAHARAAAPGRQARVTLGVVAGLAAVAGGALGTLVLMTLRPPSPEPARTLDLMFPHALTVSNMGDVQLLPDGSGLVMRATALPASGQAKGTSRLYERRFDDPAYSALAGSDDVRGFVTTGGVGSLLAVMPLSVGTREFHLERFSLNGDDPPANVGPSPFWDSALALHSGDIIGITPDFRRLEQVSRADGHLVRSVTLDSTTTRTRIRLSDVLPDDRHALVTIITYGARGYEFAAGAMDLRTGGLTRLVPGAGNPRLAAAGVLLFSHGSRIFAARFDAGALRLRGEPIALAVEARTVTEQHPARFAADAHVLCFPTGGAVQEHETLVAYDAAWHERTLLAEEHDYYDLEFARRSPVNRFVTWFSNAQLIDEVWVGDDRHGGLRRVASFPDADAGQAVIRDDGRIVAFVRNGGDDRDGVYIVDVEAGTPPVRIAIPARKGVNIANLCFLANGSGILCSQPSADFSRRLYFAPIAASDSDAVLRPVFAGNVIADQPQISPDGHWLLYTGSVADQSETFLASLTPAGAVGTAQQITHGGATFPHWSLDGRRVLYTEPSGRIVQAAITLGYAPSLGPAMPWFDNQAHHVLPGSQMPNGDLACVRLSDDDTPNIPGLRVLTSWQTLLAQRRKLPR